VWERKKEKRKMFKEKNENEERRKVFEGKIRFQKISLLFYCLTAFQTKVFQRCCCSNTAQQTH
jgi:hypothetical protein